MTTEKPYTNGIVTFLDLLGFRELLAKTPPEELSRIMNIFRSHGNPKGGHDDSFDEMFEYAALSDCFFRATDADHALNTKHPTGHFFHELLSVVFIQCRLLREKLLIRGAITLGQYRAERDKYGSVLFGPAVATAYELESKHARFPRVVVDFQLIDQFWRTETLKNVIHSHQMEWEDYLSNLLRRDDAGVWYVDYLRGIIGNFDYEPDGTGLFYLDHKKLIEEKINAWLEKKQTTIDSVGEKVAWLIQYHNSTMSALPEDDWKWILSAEDCTLEKDDFFVKPPDHPLFAAFPRTA